MDRLDAMAAFVAAVNRGSLAAASRELGYSPAAVTRAITSLEDRLGCCHIATCSSNRATSLGG